MPHSAHRLSAVEKFKDDLHRVKLSDLTYSLVMSGFFTKDDLSEILANPTKDQMKSLLRVLEGLLNKLAPPKQDELWECFIRALHNEYSHLALSIALQCDKCTRQPRAVKIRKEDIGTPIDFKHLISFTASKGAEINMTDFENPSSSSAEKTEAEMPDSDKSPRTES